MGNLGKICVLLAALSVGAAGGGYAFYKNSYAKPRAEFARQRAEFETFIETCKARGEAWDRTAANFAPLYAYSLPSNPQNSRVEYQIWLEQMLEFCNLTDPQTKAGRYNLNRSTRLAVQEYSVAASASTADLTRFLFEFYWTPFLHRITLLDMKPVENSDLLDVRMTIETAAILYKENRDPAAATDETAAATARALAQYVNYPKTDKLPLETSPSRVLASGPLAAYKPFAETGLFRAVRTGIDAADYARLTATPEVTDERGNTTRFSRWRVDVEDRTITLKVGERLQIGSFDADVVEILDDIVLLRQNEGDERIWVVPLGENLNRAAAVNLY